MVTDDDGKRSNLLADPSGNVIFNTLGRIWPITKLKLGLTLLAHDPIGPGVGRERSDRSQNKLSSQNSKGPGVFVYDRDGKRGLESNFRHMKGTKRTGVNLLPNLYSFPTPSRPPKIHPPTPFLPQDVGTKVCSRSTVRSGASQARLIARVNRDQFSPQNATGS